MGSDLSVHRDPFHLEPFDLDSKEWRERCFEDRKIENHPEYYFQDGNIIIVVEDTAFNLYRGILQRHSRVFRDIEDSSMRIHGSITAKSFTFLCQFLFPKEIGEIPKIRPGDTDFWHPVIEGTIGLLMPGVRRYILNKLAEDISIIATKPVVFLYYIQDEDEGLKEILLECIQMLAYRRSPLALDEAGILSGARVNQVALARERVRSLFYNPNYWKVQVYNTLCIGSSQHCSEGVLLAMLKQVSLSSQPSKPEPEFDLLQTAIDSMCSVCRGRYADSLKRNTNLEIRKCLGCDNETGPSNPNPPEIP